MNIEVKRKGSKRPNYGSATSCILGKGSEIRSKRYLIIASRDVEIDERCSSQKGLALGVGGQIS